MCLNTRVPLWHYCGSGCKSEAVEGVGGEERWQRQLLSRMEYHDSRLQPMPHDLLADLQRLAPPVRLANIHSGLSIRVHKLFRKPQRPRLVYNVCTILIPLHHPPPSLVHIHARVITQTPFLCLPRPPPAMPKIWAD